MAPADRTAPPDDDMDLPDIVPSALDDNTHAEVRALYVESTETLRFVKTHQWKTVGATLLTFLGLIFIAGFVNADKALAQKIHGHYHPHDHVGHLHADHLSVLDAQRDAQDRIDGPAHVEPVSARSAASSPGAKATCTATRY